MGIRELREKYGPNSKNQSVMNRAVKAEIPGAAILFDLLPQLYEKASDGDQFACHVYDEIEKALTEMKMEIAKRYDLKSERNDGHET